MADNIELLADECANDIMALQIAIDHFVADTTDNLDSELSAFYSGQIPDSGLRELPAHGFTSDDPPEYDETDYRDTLDDGDSDR